MSLDHRDGVVELAAPVERYKRPEKPPFNEELVKQGWATEALYEAEYGFLPEDHQASRDLQALLDSYPGGNKPARVRISLDNSQPDAFVLPNGTVVINRLLLSLLDTQEVQFVLAHEAIHYRERHTEEFEVLRNRLRFGRGTSMDVLRLVGGQRLGEYQADIQGIIEGDEAGTHPAALRTFMRKMEAWDRLHGVNDSSDLVHGREIERTVNAGLATQLYDFESDYLTRTPLSPAIREVCEAVLPARFPESAECDPSEAEESFRNKAPLEILVCLRNWRLADEALLDELQEKGGGAKEPSNAMKKKVQIESVPLVGEGYEVALRCLEEEITRRVPEATPLQQQALRHIVLEAIATIRTSDLEDSPFASTVDYLEQLDSPEAIEEVRQIMTADIFQKLGVVLPDGEGLPRVLSSILGAANQSEIYADEDGVFSVSAYLDGAKRFFTSIQMLLADHSLVGAEGFVLAEPILEELYLNIDTRKKTVAAADATLQFQRMLIDAGLPAQTSRIYRTLQAQKFYSRLQDEELALDDERIRNPNLSHVMDYVRWELFRNIHPVLEQTDLATIGYFMGSELFGEFSQMSFRRSYERQQVKMDVVYEVAQSKYFDIGLGWMDGAIRPIEDPSKQAENRSEELQFFIHELGERLEFEKILQSPNDVVRFCGALNQLKTELLLTRESTLSAMTIVLALFRYLLRDAKTVNWLPQEEEPRRVAILRLLAAAPGSAISEVLSSEDFLDAIVSGLGHASSDLALQVSRIVLGEETLDRKPEVGGLYRPLHNPSKIRDSEEAYRTADQICGSLIRSHIESDIQRHFIDKAQVRARTAEMDELLFRYCRVMPAESADFLEGGSTPNDGYVAVVSQFVEDLDDPEDLRLLLSLSSWIKDPLLRSEVVRTVVNKRLTDPTLNIETGINLLFRNGHVRPTLLGDVRDRFVDERVTTPVELEHLRRTVLDEFDQAPIEQVGVHALLERLEKRKDSLQILKTLLTYVEVDRELKEDVFRLLRQDWQDGTNAWEDEVTLLRTETILYGLEQASDVVKHGLVRKLLIGERGLLNDTKRRKELFTYLLDSAVETEHADPVLLATVKEVLEVVAEVAETDVLFFALAPFLQDRILKAPSKRTDWKEILVDVYNGSRLTTRTTLANVDALRRYSRGESVDDQEDAKHYFELNEAEFSENRYRVKLARLGISTEARLAATPVSGKPTLEAMIVRVAESLGADGVRFVQVLGQYVPDLSPELEEALRNANDNVRGQPKLTAYETSRRRSLGLKVSRMGSRLGGGSLMSPYDSDIEAEGITPRRVALKVLAPNAEFVSDTVEAELRRVVDVLVQRNAEKYLPAKQALEDISSWIRADVNDTRFFELDPGFREAHGGFQVPGFRYAMFVPTSIEVPGGATANKYLKAEEFVAGTTLNRLLADSQGHDLKQAVSLIAKSFAQQLVRGVMHSDVHPGNYMLAYKDGRECVAMIDRNFYLELTNQDQELVFRITDESATASERIHAMKDYFAEDSEAKKQDPVFWAGLQAQFDAAGERAMSVVTARLRAVGVKIPLKFTLLLKNINSLNRMAQRVGFGSFREALGYLPADA